MRLRLCNGSDYLAHQYSVFLSLAAGTGSVCISDLSFTSRLQPGDHAASHQDPEPFSTVCFSLQCHKALVNENTSHFKLNRCLAVVSYSRSCRISNALIGHDLPRGKIDCRFNLY